MTATLPSNRLPPAAWVMIGIPAVAVIASFITLGLALNEREPTLPNNFNWEGAPLERDIARAARAGEIGARAILDLSAQGGRCSVAFSANTVPPDVLVVQLTHATNPDLDRTWALRPASDGYTAACEPVPAGHWYVTLSDGAESWRIRQEVTGTLGSITLTAAPPPEAPSP